MSRGGQANGFIASCHLPIKTAGRKALLTLHDLYALQLFA